MQGGFAVLDFGSQFTQLIARRLREIGVYSEIFPYDVDIARIRKMEPKGIILSGGPNSVYDADSPRRHVRELIEVAPVLGICYGMQLIAHDLGGIVKGSDKREYGRHVVDWDKPVEGIPHAQTVWMSHGDVVEVPPVGFEIVGRSETGLVAAMRGPRCWGIQFHPEVSHTEFGMELLRSFAFEFCGADATWNSAWITHHLLEEIQNKVGPSENVLCALSGGVDSTVVAALLTKALGSDRVHCIFVDNGLLRKNESRQVLANYKQMGLNVRGIDASRQFLDELAGVEDPEKKRKIIGRVFLEVFEAAVDLSSVQWLAQGTLYPDVIESVSLRGTSVTIKSHHNVGGLPEKMNLKLIEPLRELFKDEVRAMGEQLGLPREAVWRHPFPGPGLAIRVLGPVNKEHLDILRDCDEIYLDELRKNGLYDKIWQAFSVLLPVKTVGVQGDSRSYERVLALRAVTATDGMTADWFAFDPAFMRALSNRLTNEVKGINRVVYDISSKPPATIEWE